MGAYLCTLKTYAKMGQHHGIYFYATIVCSSFVRILQLDDAFTDAPTCPFSPGRPTPPFGP